MVSVTCWDSMAGLKLHRPQPKGGQLLFPSPGLMSSIYLMDASLNVTQAQGPRGQVPPQRRRKALKHKV